METPTWQFRERLASGTWLQCVSEGDHLSPWIGCCRERGIQSGMSLTMHLPFNTT